MARTVDITDKLDFETSPALIINGKEYTVNADASTVLKIMSMAGEEEGMTNKDLIKSYDIIFPEKTRKDFEKLKLSFKDLTVVIEAAMDLVVGDGGESDGEKQ